MAFDNFHPAVAAWFRDTFPSPTAAQIAAWPAFQSNRHALIAAPTGSGKTLAAFLAAIDMLVRKSVAHELPDETFVVYVSPLKALSNDVAINLDAPLAGIDAQLEKLGLRPHGLRTAVRTGDTPQSARNRMRRTPPHVLVTTPESLYILLGSESGRRLLASTRSVIVDEIHAMVDNKRGAHLTLTLERLEALCGRRLVRIGLSATQKPIDAVARFLVGRDEPCTIVDVGFTQRRDLAIEVPPVSLEAVMSNDVWELVYQRLAELIGEHRTTLIFVNTRRMAERATKHLSDRLGKDVIAAHHGSLSRELRLDAEGRLKRGELRALVATASLELGIDIGDVDLVCQLGSPRSIAAFLQRVGRSGHSVGGTPKGRLFPQSRDDLVECAALLDCVRRGELDTLRITTPPLDVLAQQIVAEVGCQEWDENALFRLFCRAYPFTDMSRETYGAVVQMLAEGYSTRRGARLAPLHRDAVHGRLRGRRGGQLIALTSGGTIPDTADYPVVLEPQAHVIGSVNEDFAVESLAGDVFQLGNASYRILRVERDRVRVEDAHGAPPNIPFWLGEAPGRSDELSFGVARLRGEIAQCLDTGEVAAAERWLIDTLGLDAVAAGQIAEYLARAQAALGLLPTQHELAMERFFDESGGTQLVIHAPLGSRINKAWGLALRKRFCRQFNFELQAAATDDAIVLSLSTSHSFPLDEVQRYLHSTSAQDVLVQALLDAPMFGARWRWNATTALALPRYLGGRKVAPQIQRMKAEDLLATVFPDQVACAENLVGEREIPDHPLVAQTLHDCLHEAMDVNGLLRLLRGLECGVIHITTRELTGPSPLAAEVLSARPYAYLDDAPLEERRTLAVMSRRGGGIEDASDLGRLDAGAVDAVREEAWPEARNIDEMHETLMTLGFVTIQEAERQIGWPALLAALAADRRATQFDLPQGALWSAAERLPQFAAIHTNASPQPPIGTPTEFTAQTWARESALVELLRSRLSGLGPACVDELATSLSVERPDAELALIALQTEGYVMRGRFTPGGTNEEWCERHLLARIHRYTVGRLRREIEPVEVRDFLRFLFDWQHVAAGARLVGPDALSVVLGQLEGFEAAAAAWESELLPARVADFEPAALDAICHSGRAVWFRLRATNGGAGPVRATPIVVLPRRNLAAWSSLAATPNLSQLSSRAQAVADHLQHHGASFFDELVDATRLLETELEDALSELVACGFIHADSFSGLRALLTPAEKRRSASLRRRRTQRFGIQDAGRWVLVRHVDGAHDERGCPAPDMLEHIARTLLARYGVMCWRLLEREANWLPPWRELARVYHRLEARGEIRGGRFIAGLTGEQFALPEAVGLLRAVRKRPHDGSLVVVAGTDPLNLSGILGGVRIPAVRGSRLVYRDGVPMASQVGGETTFFQPLSNAEQLTIRETLKSRHIKPVMLPVGGAAHVA